MVSVAVTRGWTAERSYTGDPRTRRRPAGPFCAMCWGARRIWEPGPLGLWPVWCEACRGTGRALNLHD